MAAAAVPSRIPAFYNFFNPDFSSQRLQIPSAFISKMKGKLPENTAFLRDAFGNVWPVEVIREGRNKFFENGWAKFVQDNGVELGDILIFQFNGDYHFDVKQFGKDTCEKVEDVGSFQLTINPEEKEEERARKSSDCSGEEEDEDVKVRKNKRTGWKKKTGGSSATGGKYGTTTRRGKGKAAVKDEVRSKDNANEADRRRCSDVFESGLIARPTNPFFVYHVNAKKRNEMNIPFEVIKDHNLEIPGEIIIVGEDGKEFHSNISTWGDGRKRVTNGWRAFRRWNAVKDEDTCLCEFVSTHTLLIRVLAFQAGKWMPRPTGKNPPEVSDTDMVPSKFNEVV